jgi:hypothetical protein
MLYVPALQGWTRLCGAVDVHANVASGLLTDAVPLESGANSLLALSLIDSPPIQQRVNELGVTTLAPAREDFRMDVLPETVPEGVYIEMTSLPRSLHNSTVQLISDPIDLKACAVDHTALPESSQLNQFPKPFRLEFRYSAATANRAGGAANLTVVTLQNGRWVNVENLGLRPSRSGNAVSIEVDFLGVFSLAVQ